MANSVLSGNRYSVVVFLTLQVGNDLFANAVMADGKEVDQVSTVLSLAGSEVRTAESEVHTYYTFLI